MSTDKIRIAALAAVITCAVLISGALNLPAVSDNAAQTSGDISVTENRGGYTIRSCGDCIGIFAPGSDTPLRIISVDPASLPADARKLLDAGITVESREELLLLIEDYIS